MLCMLLNHLCLLFCCELLDLSSLSNNVSPWYPYSLHKCCYTLSLNTLPMLHSQYQVAVLSSVQCRKDMNSSSHVSAVSCRYETIPILSYGIEYDNLECLCNSVFIQDMLC